MSNTLKLAPTSCGEDQRDKWTFSAYVKNYPAPTYAINVSESFKIHCTGKVPNWFRRKMYKLFFGWSITVL